MLARRCNRFGPCIPLRLAGVSRYAWPVYPATLGRCALLARASREQLAMAAFLPCCHLEITAKLRSPIVERIDFAE